MSSPLLPRPIKFNKYHFEAIPYDIWEYILLNFIQYDDLILWFGLNESYYESFIHTHSSRSELCQRIFPRMLNYDSYHNICDQIEHVYTHGQWLYHGRHFRRINHNILTIDHYVFGKRKYKLEYRLTKHVTMDQVLDTSSAAGCILFRKTIYDDDIKEIIDINKRGKIINRIIRQKLQEIIYDRVNKNIIILREDDTYYKYHHAGRLIRWKLPIFMTNYDNYGCPYRRLLPRENYDHTTDNFTCNGIL